MLFPIWKSKNFSFSNFLTLLLFSVDLQIYLTSAIFSVFWDMIKLSLDLNSFVRVRFHLTTLIYFELQFSLCLLFLNICCLKTILVKYMWKQNIHWIVLSYLILSLSIRGNLVSNLSIFVCYTVAYSKKILFFYLEHLEHVLSIIYVSCIYLIYLTFLLCSVYIFPFLTCALL